MRPYYVCCGDVSIKIKIYLSKLIHNIRAKHQMVKENVSQL